VASIGNSTSSVATGNVNTISVAVPTGATTADAFLLTADVVDGGSGTTTFTWPSGFTEIASSATEGVIGSRLRAAIKAATGLESGSFVTNFSNFGQVLACCAVVQGVSATLVTSSANAPAEAFGSSISLAGAAVTTGAANNFSVLIGGVCSGGVTAVATFTQPTSFTKNRTVDAGQGNALGLASFVEPTNGSVTYTTGSMGYTASQALAPLVLTLVFAPTASGAVLAGAAAIVGTATGTLTGTAALLAGSAAAAGSATGTLTSAAAQLAGTPAATASATGTLTTTAAQLAATPSGAASATGALTTGIPLSGSAASAVNAAGTFSGSSSYTQGPTMFISAAAIGLLTPVAISATNSSLVINTQGLSKGSVGIVSDHLGTLSVQRYVDAGGVLPVGAAITDNTSPYAVSWVDGIPCGSIVVSFINTAGAVANLSSIAVNLAP
jgi:hypothetical protein